MESGQKVEYKDEIDLKELFLTIWKRRIFVVMFTFILTFFGALFAFFKPYAPMYQGQMIIEIGDVFNKDDNVRSTEAPGNLIKNIIIFYKDNYIDEKVLDGFSLVALEGILKNYGFSLTAPKGSNNLVEIELKSEDKNIIKDILTEIGDFIIARHKERNKMYEKFTPTQIIGEISISEEPINEPKRVLIVVISFISGLILSIFLILFMQDRKSVV